MLVWLTKQWSLSGSLTFEQIIAHHNELLDGFDAGKHSIQVVPLQKVGF